MKGGKGGLRLVRLSTKEAAIICIEYKRGSCGWREEEKKLVSTKLVYYLSLDMNTWPRGVKSKKKKGWNRFQFKLK